MEDIYNFLLIGISWKICTRRTMEHAKEGMIIWANYKINLQFYEFTHSIDKYPVFEWGPIIMSMS